MRRSWRLALLVPLVLVLGACLDPGAVTMPEDEEQTGEPKPDENAMIVLVQEVA